ncbi:hypothetical protein J6590_008608 [Homalodisca vitripennis]|nr:hypothetical protein J6590_008608 [Homalodisca vitripennis]
MYYSVSERFSPSESVIGLSPTQPDCVRSLVNSSLLSINLLPMTSYEEPEIVDLSERGSLSNVDIPSYRSILYNLPPYLLTLTSLYEKYCNKFTVVSLVPVAGLGLKALARSHLEYANILWTGTEDTSTLTARRKVHSLLPVMLSSLIYSRHSKNRCHLHLDNAIRVTVSSISTSLTANVGLLQKFVPSLNRARSLLAERSVTYYHTFSALLLKSSCIDSNIKRRMRNSSVKKTKMITQLREVPIALLVILFQFISMPRRFLLSGMISVLFEDGYSNSGLRKPPDEKRALRDPEMLKAVIESYSNISDSLKMTQHNKMLIDKLDAFFCSHPPPSLP